MNDRKPFKHGQEGTHGCCNKRLKEEGGKARCCMCVPHKECEIQNLGTEEEKSMHLDQFLKNFDFKGLAEACRKSEIAWSAVEWKEFIEKIRKDEREQVIKELLSGSICTTCGGKKTPNPMSDVCDKCYEGL